MARITDTQKNILQFTDAQSKISSYDMGGKLGIPSGPTARAMSSMVDKGWLKVATTKEGDKVYSRTAEGGKIAKKL
jgi:DNA-binding PadR family transcriptional regulator